MTNGSLVLSGGGLDALVAAWEAAVCNPMETTTLLVVDYGQRARDKEFHATRKIARSIANGGYKADWLGYRLDFFQQLARSPLLDLGAPVEKDPQPGIAHEWTPARNTVLMALGVSFAEAHEYSRVVTGINATAALAYPDNSVAWHEAWAELVQYAVGPKTSLEIKSPLMYLSKADIVKRGEQLHVPWAETESWSCYEGEALHCGRCSSCRARRIAFREAGVTDPTMYKLEVR
jgi:7-cyano-7-deazaguanine synthase